MQICRRLVILLTTSICLMNFSSALGTTYSVDNPGWRSVQYNWTLPDKLLASGTKITKITIEYSYSKCSHDKVTITLSKKNGDAAPIYLVQDGSAQYVSEGPVTWTSPDNYFANSKANDVWTLRMDITGNACFDALPNCTAPYSGHSASFTPGTMTIYSDQTWPTLSFPADYSFTGSSSNSRMVFQWGSLPNADSYKLFIDDSSDPSNVFTVKTISTASTTFDTASDSSIQLQALHTYSWKVAAVNAVGTGYDSGSRQFIVGPTAECWPALGVGYGNSGYQNDIHSCYNLGSSTGNFLLKDISRRGNMNVHSHNGNMSDNASISTQRYGEYSPMSSWNSFWGIDADAGERPGVDAHVNAGKVYDYLNSKYQDQYRFYLPPPSWISILLYQNPWTSIVESNEIGICPDYVAYFDYANPLPTVIYCAGLNASSLLDIVGHEWTHALTWRATSRGYNGYLGAYEGFYGEGRSMDEAFSDWMATAIKQAPPNNINNWVTAIDEYKRDLSNPLISVPPQPVYYGGQYWINTFNCGPTNSQDLCGAYTNMGVPNKMFYLLSMGEEGVQGVQAIGIEKAIKIAFKANTERWGKNLTFAAARDGMIWAAGQLFGPWEVDQVNKAWAAVGVTPTSTPEMLAIRRILPTIFSMLLSD